MKKTNGHHYTPSEFQAIMRVKGINQSECGLLLGVTGRAVCNYVHGKRKIRPQIWVKMDKVRELSKQDIFNKIVKARTAIQL